MSTTTTIDQFGTTTISSSGSTDGNGSTDSDSGYLWDRRWSLSVGTADGNTAVALSTSDDPNNALAFDFDIQATLNQTAWSAVITVYNIDPSTLSRLQKELTVVQLQAGYKSPAARYGQIFMGPVVYYRAGKLDAANTFVEIHAMVNDPALNAAPINTTDRRAHV